MFEYKYRTDYYLKQDDLALILILMCGLTFQSKKISNDQELIRSDPISCPQNKKGNN